MLMLAVIILVGNKSDLTEQREVTTETGQEYAERCDQLPHMCMSIVLIMHSRHPVLGSMQPARWSVPAARQPNAHNREIRIWLCRNSMLFMETSAKTAANVAAIFEAVALKLAGNGGAAQLQTSPDTPAVSS